VLNESILELIARVIEWCEPPRADGPGHPPAETVRVLATLRCKPAQVWDPGELRLFNAVWC